MNWHSMSSLNRTKIWKGYGCDTNWQGGPMEDWWRCWWATKVSRVSFRIELSCSDTQRDKSFLREVLPQFWDWWEWVLVFLKDNCVMTRLSLEGWRRRWGLEGFGQIFIQPCNPIWEERLSTGDYFVCKQDFGPTFLSSRLSLTKPAISLIFPILLCVLLQGTISLCIPKN